MSKRLAEAGSQFLASRTSRRGFLRRAALAGTALVAAPATYVLRPGDAYSAVVNTPSSCPPRQQMPRQRLDRILLHDNGREHLPARLHDRRLVASRVSRIGHGPL